MKRTRTRGTFAALAALTLLILAIFPANAVPRQQAVVDICSRTRAVQDAIINAIGGTCSAVTNTQLAGIAKLQIEGYSNSSIVPGDLAGLTGLRELWVTDSPDLTTVPANAFSELTGTTLRFLGLNYNAIKTVNIDAFDGLDQLQFLSVSYNTIDTLQPGVFDGLSNLEHLHLRFNNLSSLPEDIFSEISSLEVLNLEGNSLTSIHADVFSGLTALTALSQRQPTLYPARLHLRPAGQFGITAAGRERHHVLAHRHLRWSHQPGAAVPQR